MNRRIPSRSSAIEAELLGHRLRFEIQPGLFSVDRIDDGTRLLLEWLPKNTPQRVLDLGCGYGALGLPVAARFPEAECVLVDRNAIATRQALENAIRNRLANVQTLPSLGYRELGAQSFDWILCNVPARIGAEALQYFIDEGTRRLTPQGSLRIVVIRDLVTLVEEISAYRGCRVERIHDGPRHTVFSFFPIAAKPANDPDHESFYARDRTTVAGLSLERPHDISEDRSHLEMGLPLLLELLPRKPARRALVWRGGYGGTALTLAGRGAKVSAADPDLLQTTFVQRNARQERLAIDVWTAPDVKSLPNELGKARLFVGEFPASLELPSASSDVVDALDRVEPGGDILWLGLTRQTRPMLERLSRQHAIRFVVLATRDVYTVWRITPPA